MIFEKVKALIKSELNFSIDDLKLESTLEDMGADSLDAVELIMAIEETFNIEIPEDAAREMKSLQNIVSYIEAHTG